MDSLTERQREVLHFLARFSRDHGYPPTVRDIGAGLSMKSPNTVHTHLMALRDKGYIAMEPGKNRNIRLLMPPPESCSHLPLVGSIAAGSPILAVENLEDTLEVDRSFFGHPESFSVRVRGDSMIQAHIQDGDYVVIRPKDQPENGDVVAALIDGEVTLKYFFRTRSGVELRPANPRYAPLCFTPDAGADLRILGVMAGLIRRV